MEYLILYFSGTGNTALIADEIKKRLKRSNHSVELVSIENHEELLNLNFENKIIGFGYPLYKFSYPDNFNAIFPKINELAKGNKYFQFSTYARFYANSFYDFSSQLDKTKYHLITERSFKAPSCGISARKPVEDYEYKSVMFFEDQIGEKLDEFVDQIMLQGSTKEKQKHNMINGLKKLIVKDVEIVKYPKLKIYQDQCTMCGLCASACPDKNLTNVKTYIKINDEVGCLHCLRCMNHCPSNAITFGELTEGDNQYTLKIRNELLDKAVRGHHEEYWTEFDKIVNKWKRNTLKYWMKHKYKRE